jgi:hypothetical protein
MARPNKTRYDDDDDDDFENGVLKDGHSFRVPFRMCDSLQRSVAQHFSGRNSPPMRDATRLHDGHGGRVGHKPGFIVSDAVADDACRKAYRDYSDALTNAWRHDAAPPGAYPLSSGEGTACTINGALGTLVREGRWLVCKPSQQDASTLDARDKAYTDYENELTNAWRRS